jgi:outer membrane protein
VPLTPAGPAATPLTLAQALAAASEHNPRLSEARAEISLRLAGIAAAKGSFDTALTASLDLGLARRPSPDRADGAVQDTSLGGTVGYQHRLHAGTSLGVSLSHRYADSAGVLTVLAPQFTTDLRVTATQPLLRGRGSDVNLAEVGSATLLADAAKLDLRRVHEEVLAQVAQSYWAVAQAQEEVTIRRRTYDRAEQVHALTLELIKRGSLPQAATVQAASTRALRRARLQAAERILEDAQAALVRAILDEAPVRVAAADPMPAPAAAPAAPVVDRADLRAAELRAAATAELVKTFEDRAQPALDLSLFAGLSGLGGTSNALACQLFTPQGGPAPAGCVPGGDFDGYGSAWSSVVTGGYYTAGVAASLALPIVDEGAQGQAQQARATVERARVVAEGLRRQVEAEVAALRQLVVSDRLAFQTAEEARTITTQLIDVEEQRYKVGSATTFDVLRVQDDLAEAESLASTARAAVLISDLRYQLAAGRVREHLGVAAEAP